MRSVPLSRVVLMGYSAGALMASWVALNLPKPCAGLILLSGLCPCEPRLPEPRQVTLRMTDTPILYMCGADDVQIPAKHVRRHALSLEQKGFLVTFREFPGVGHELIEEEFDEIINFLVATLPADLPHPAEASRDSLAKEIARLDRKLDTSGNATRSVASSQRGVRPCSSSGRPSSAGRACAPASNAGLARNCSSAGSSSGCARPSQQQKVVSRSSSMPLVKAWRR